MARCAEFRLKIELLREKEHKCSQTSSNFWEKAYILPIICTFIFPKKGLHNQKKALIQDFNPLRKIKREQLETMRTQIKNFIVLLVALVASTEGMTPNTTMTDPRDGTEYKAIAFGPWTWTTENMRYDIGKNFCQKDDPSCKKYGRYYGEENASQVWIKAKRTQIIKDFFANTKCIYDTERNINEIANFWTSTQEWAGEAYRVSVDVYENVRPGLDQTVFAFSVRCLKN